MKMKPVVGVCAAVLLLATAWCWYALSIPGRTLAEQGLCQYPLRVRLVDITRHLFGVETSAQINADIAQRYGLASPAWWGCAD
jgi:hypothetical protein